MTALLLLALAARAQEDAAEWLRADGVDGIAWGTDSVPLDSVPRPRDYVLPDAVFIASRGSAAAEDLELRAPAGERRFVRYVFGALVDAWRVREGALDPAPLVGGASPDWSGVVLGPGEDGWLALGDATSWTVGARTVLHWKDRLGRREVLVSRAVPTPQYGIGRAAPLTAPVPAEAPVRLSGDLKKAARPLAPGLSTCFETSRKPVGAAVRVRFDGAGQPSRLQVSADQPVFGLDDCVAAALLPLRGPAGGEGSLALLRFR